MVSQAASSSLPPEEPEPYYEIYPWAVNKPGDKPAKPPLKTAKSLPASAKPALASAPPFKRASSLKQVSSVKQTPSLQRTSSLKQTPTIKRAPSVKRTPSVESVDVDPIEAAFHSHENTILGNSIVEVLARLDLEAAEETSVVARDARCAFAGKEGALSVIGNAATSEISALHRSTTATLGPCTFRQVDGTHAPLLRSASAGELSVVPGVLSGDEEGDEERAPSEHRGFHF